MKDEKHESLKEIWQKRIGEIRLCKDDIIIYDGMLLREDNGELTCYPGGAETWPVDVRITLDKEDSLKAPINIKSKVFAK